VSEFTFLFRGSNPATHSPEQMQKYAQQWFAWVKDLTEKGHIDNPPGHPLEYTGKIVKGPDKSVHDGPFAEAKDVINGYFIVRAGDLSQAVEVAKGCPLLELGGSVEVRPIRIMTN
jgi:hypothetical protein